MLAISPSFRDYIEKRLFTDRTTNSSGQTAAQEFINRLNDPCASNDNYSPVLVAELDRVITNKRFCQEFKQTLQYYDGVETPRMSPDLRKYLKTIIDPKFYLEFERLMQQECIIYRNLYSTSFNYTETVGYPIDAGIYGTTGGAGQADDYQTIATFLQTITPDAGCFQDSNSGNFVVSLWIMMAAEPVGWTADGNPLVWTEVVTPSEVCHRATVGVPDTALWYMWEMEGLGQGSPATALAYDDAGFSAALASNTVYWFGANATSSYAFTANTYTIGIFNTYIQSVRVRSTDFVTFVYDNLNLIACP